jgi:hypothetical protein
MFMVQSSLFATDRPVTTEMSDLYDGMPAAVLHREQSYDSLIEHCRAHADIVSTESSNGTHIIKTTDTFHKLFIGEIPATNIEELNGHPVYVVIHRSWPAGLSPAQPEPVFKLRIKRRYVGACTLAALQAYIFAGYFGAGKGIPVEVSHDAEGLPSWMVKLPIGTTVNVEVIPCEVLSSDAMTRTVGGVQDVASDLAQVVQRVEDLDMEE